VSDQNQWPKPDDSNADGRGAGTPSDAGQSGQSGQSQQYGASAPEPPRSAGSSDPWAQSGQGAAAQGVSEGHTAPQAPQNPYAAPGQHQSGNPYPSSGPGQQQPGYGAPQNPYAAPQNPYAQQPGTNPYAQQNPYGQQPGANPYAVPGAYAPGGYQPYAQRPKTNVLAILSIVFAFGGILVWPLVILTSPAGAIMGHIALGKIRQTGEGGRGLALAGVIGGWALTALYIVIVLLFVLLGIAAGTSGRYSDYNGYDSGAFIG
jgi:hypothetical protein